MAAMNPILRLRRAFRSLGADDEQADEVADAIVDHSFSRPETELMFQREMALMRQQFERIRNEILIAVLVIVGVAVAILALVN